MDIHAKSPQRDASRVGHRTASPKARIVNVIEPELCAFSRSVRKPVGEFEDARFYRPVFCHAQLLHPLEAALDYAALHKLFHSWHGFVLMPHPNEDGRIITRLHALFDALVNPSLKRV